MLAISQACITVIPSSNSTSLLSIIINFPLENLKEAIIIVNKIKKYKNYNNNIIDLRVPNQLILSNE